MKHDITKMNYENGDFKYLKEPICPYCGQEVSNAWELHFECDGDETEIECGYCGESFKIVADIIIKYCCYKTCGVKE